ncbi:MAG TPA: glycerol-3-phosphate acyltransferase, partial [Candidatus Fermentibacter sp.]|nr:glycerol-3-phosphate acyltransferase [Candidatus Fermentibacter sp.]
LGGVSVMAPLPLLAALAVFAAVLAARRFVSLASVAAAVALSAAALLLPCGLPGRIACILIAILLIARHAGNMRRILPGTERRLGEDS